MDIARLLAAEAVSALKLSLIESFAVGASFATMPFGFNQDNQH